MSIISSFLNFFVPPRRRKPPVVPTGGAVEPLAPGAERAFGRGLDEALAAVNAPAQVGDFIKADLDAALSPTGRMPAYYPGAPTPLTISLLGLFTDPWEEVKTVYTKNFATKWTDLFYTPEDLVGAVNKAALDYLADRVWVSAGRSVVPLSLRETLYRYNARAPKSRALQITARGLVTRNPGMTLMLAHRLNLHYSAVPGATYDAEILAKISTFQSISAEAQRYESGIAAAVAGEDWAEASRLQEEWAERNRDLIREAFAEFKSLAGQPGSPLYNSAEAQFLRYFKSRDQFFGTLNFLKTFKKDGFWGVMKQYAWRDLVLGEGFSGLGIAIKGLNIRGKILNKLDKAVRKSPFGKLASKLVSFREAGKRLRKKFTKAVMQKGLEKLGLKQLVAFLGKLLAKLIGTLGNTVAPWVAVAAGVILSFFTDLIVDAVGGLLKALGYLTGGLISCLILFGVGFVVLISIILGNIPYPWETGGGAGRFANVCEVAEAYNIPCCQLEGVMEVETGSGTGGSGSCQTNHGSFSCCTGNVCGPAQVACGQYNAFAGRDNIDMCSLVGSAELLSRAMLLKLCQADSVCDSYSWDEWGDHVKENYEVNDGDYTAAAYFYGLANGCTVTACSQFRWGAGKGYCDSVEAYCETGNILPDATDGSFCEECNEEIIRAGQTPIDCSIYE